MKTHVQSLPNRAQSFVMIHIEGGSFNMGDEHGDLWEFFRPVHQVTVSNFYLGKYPVTQALWRAVVEAESVGVTQSHPDTSLNPNPSYFQGDDLPVEQVSWDDAQLFIKKLNALTKSSRLPGYTYRLPTEAEWEYAVRGGKFHAEGYKYAGSDRLKDVGWFNDNSVSTTKPVGLKYPNQLGLHDMSGNVRDWCEDDWHSDYEGAPEDGSAWIDTPERGSSCVIRGGSWNHAARLCRAAYRSGGSPVNNRWDDIGFRLALSLQ